MTSAWVKWGARLILPPAIARATLRGTLDRRPKARPHARCGSPATTGDDETEAERGLPDSGDILLKRQRDRERGASLVEFALVLPIFMMLVLGMFTGGIAYNRKISLANAAREGSRYGATLPLPSSPDVWLSTVAATAQDNASGDLDAGTAGRSICVAYVHPAGTAPDVTHKLVRTNAGDTFTSGPLVDPCFTDGRPGTDRRVQVHLQRTSKLEVLLFTTDLTLTGRSVTRFEATT